MAVALQQAEGSARLEPWQIDEDFARLARLTDRIGTSADLADVLSPLLGMLLRPRQEAVA